MDLIKFLGIDYMDKTKYIFEGNNWIITFDKYVHINKLYPNGCYFGIIESKLPYSFHYVKEEDSVYINSAKLNVKYHEDSIPSNIPKYIIKKIKEIAYTIIFNPEYYEELNKTIEKNRINPFEILNE